MACAVLQHNPHTHELTFLLICGQLLKRLSVLLFCNLLLLSVQQTKYKYMASMLECW